MRSELRILVTGGTFDKVYNPVTEKLEFTETSIHEILRIGRATAKVAVETLMLKDSLYMTDSDGQRILQRCQDCPEKKLLIVHGTGTMVETAMMLGQGLKGKMAVLTGAMVPYRMRGSDAVFNFGCAFSAALALPVGVYIAMNGRIFRWNNVRKNTDLGHFDTIK